MLELHDPSLSGALIRVGSVLFGTLCLGLVERRQLVGPAVRPMDVQPSGPSHAVLCCDLGNTTAKVGICVERTDERVDGPPRQSATESKERPDRRRRRGGVGRGDVAPGDDERQLGDVREQRKARVDRSALRVDAGGI